MELAGSGSGSGHRQRKCEPERRRVQRSLEYPCVSRLRHRRLLAFLWRHDFGATFDALVQETRVFFRVGHLQQLVRQGRWLDAISSHRRRHVKNEDRIPASDIARFYLHKKRGLPSSSHCQEKNYLGVSCDEALLADIMVESLQTGMLVGYPFKHSCNEGVTGAPVVQAFFSWLDSPFKNYGISSETIADMMRPLIISDIDQQGSVARNNPTRLKTTAHQEISPTRQQITRELGQHAESNFQEYYSQSQVDGRVRIIESST